MKSWNAYWFRPAPYIDLAVVRIFAVSCQLAMLLFSSFYAAAQFELLATLPEPMYDPITVLKLLLLPVGWDYRPSLQFVMVVYYVTVLSGVLALVGLRTNLALLIFSLGNTFLVAYAYSHGDFHHTQAPLIIALGILTLSPAGRVLSLDRWLRQRRRPELAIQDLLAEEGSLAGWPIRLVQWLFVPIYLSAVMSKLVFDGGLEWLNGYTLQYYLIQDSLGKGGTLLGAWFAQHHTLVLLSQYLVVIFQATFALAVIFPLLRWIYVPIGLSFHAANWLALYAPFPEWMALYAVFIPWRRVFEIVARRRAATASENRAAA